MHSLVPRPSITGNTVEGLVKLLLGMTSGGRYTEHKLKNKNRGGLGMRLWLYLERIRTGD